MNNDQSYITSLTGLRAVAATWVMLMHFREITPTRVWHYPVADQFVANGAYGVDVFFVLSGFILCHVYASSFVSRPTIGQFWRFVSYRIARIYPVHVVTFSFMVLLFALDKLSASGVDVVSHRYDLLTALTSLTMTNAWVPGIQTPNMPAWSISAEWFAYLIFPALCVLLNRKKYVAVGYVLAGLALAVVGDHFGYSLAHVLAGFLVGVALQKILSSRLSAASFPYAGIITCVLVVAWASGSRPNTETGLLLFAVLIAALTNPHDIVARILSLSPLVYLGEISYSLYMCHWPVRIVIRTGLQLLGVLDRIPSFVAVCAYVVGSVVTAMLIYRFVEAPGRTLLRRLSSIGGKREGRLLGGASTH